MTSSGPLSPDGKHQLVDGQWVPVPKPPRSRLDRAHDAFSGVATVLVVLLVVVILAFVLFT